MQANAYFSPVELDLGQYLFVSLPGTIVRYNVLHDLESLWWCAVFVCAAFIVVKASVEAPGENAIVQTEEEAANISATQFRQRQIFMGCLSEEHRRNSALQIPYNLLNNVRNFVQPAGQIIAAEFEDQRRHIIDTYQAAEKTIEKLDDGAHFFTHATGLYTALEASMAEILEKLPADIEVIRYDDPSAFTSRTMVKRGRSTSAASSKNRPTKKRRV